MKLIIDIPEDVYKKTVFYREFKDLNDCVTTIKALENGTPIPDNATVCDIEDIKAEIYKERTNISFNLSEEKAKWVNSGIYDGLVWAEEIIDKHISGKGRE